MLRTILLGLALCVMTLAAKADGVPLGTENLQALKGARRVAIDEFGVEFVTALKAGSSAAGTTASVAARLVGPDNATFQALTQRAYDDTVAALQAAGFEVVPQAALQAHAGYQALAGRIGKPSPYVLDESTGTQMIFAPDGMKAFFQTSGASTRGSFSDRMSALDVSHAQAAATVAKDLGATMLRFHYVASFGTASAAKGFLANFTGRARASVKVEPNLLDKETAMQFVTTDGPRIFTTSTRSGVTGAAFLSRPLVAPAAGFSMVDTTSEASKDQDAAANAMGRALAAARAMATGNDQSAAQQSRSTGDVQVEPATLTERYLGLIAAARDAFIAELKAAR